MNKHMSVPITMTSLKLKHLQ